MASATTPNESATFIAQRDRAFRLIVAASGPPPRRRLAPINERYASLVRSITFQLLATKSAETIHQRVVALCDGTVSAQRVIELGPEQLRMAGLSRAKALAMVDLAIDVDAGRVVLARHGRMSDAEILSDVVSVRGIGPWTAQMYLMFTMARRDVWPAGDFGVRNGWTILHGLDEIVSEAELRKAGSRFEGVRSDVAWYCWQAVHPVRSTK